MPLYSLVPGSMEISLNAFFRERRLDNLFYFITKQQQKAGINGIPTQRQVKVFSKTLKAYSCLHNDAKIATAKGGGITLTLSIWIKPFCWIFSLRFLKNQKYLRQSAND